MPLTKFPVNGRALKLKATLETELEALDRSLVMMLTQIPPHEADAPPARIVNTLLFILLLQVVTSLFISLLLADIQAFLRTSVVLVSG